MLAVAKGIRHFSWDDISCSSEYVCVKGFRYPLGTLMAVIGRGDTFEPCHSPKPATSINWERTGWRAALQKGI